MCTACFIVYSTQTWKSFATPQPMWSETSGAFVFNTTFYEDMQQYVNVTIKLFQMYQYFSYIGLGLKDNYCLID